MRTITTGIIRGLHSTGIFRAIHTTGIFRAIHITGAFRAIHTTGMFIAIYTTGIFRASHRYGTTRVIHTSGLFRATHTTIRVALSFHGMMESIRVLSKPRDGGKRTLVLVAFLAMFLNQTCKVGEQDVTVLFVQVRY